MSKDRKLPPIDHSPRLRVVHLSAADRIGGADRAAHRLHRGLRVLGVDSWMLVQCKTGDDPYVVGPSGALAAGLGLARPTLERLPLALFAGRRPTPPFHLQWMADGTARRLRALQPDLVHLHWICGGFVRIESVAGLRPAVWTLHDMWPLTGGCHYPGPCDAFRTACRRCMQLGACHGPDLAAWVWRRKRRAWRRLGIHLVAPSRWIAQRAAESPLLGRQPLEQIANGLDLERFRPLNRAMARCILGLPQEPWLVLFGAVKAADDRRKGMRELIRALAQLPPTIDGRRVEAVVFGAAAPPGQAPLPLPSHWLGRLHDEVSVALLYAACDVFVLPSAEDNLPNTVMEALACGTPCVAFAVGGVPEMVTAERSGYLARPADTADLAAGIAWVLGDGTRWRQLCLAARQDAFARYRDTVVARRHLDLYRRILAQRPTRPGHAD